MWPMWPTGPEHWMPEGSYTHEAGSLHAANGHCRTKTRLSRHLKQCVAVRYDQN